MIGRATLNSLLVGFVAVFCLLIHSPEATATRAPGVQVPSRCPIHNVMAFASASTRLFSIPARSVDHMVPSRSRAPPGTVSMVATIPAERAEGEEDKQAKRERRLAQAAEKLDVHVLGLSHHNAAVDVREKLAIPQDNWVDAAQELVQHSNGAIEEAAVLSTCNRFEVYFAARDSKLAMRSAAAYLADRSGLTQGSLRRNLFMLAGEDATWHLLRVSAGLDSLIVGEGQILSQVSACYQAAISDNGMGGKVLSRMLNQAVRAGKRVRTETAISKGAVSISSAAVEFSLSRSSKDLKKNFENCRIVIVGAGKMSRLLVTHLKSHGIKKVVLVNRSVGPGSRAQELADEHPELEWEFHTMDEMYNAITSGDVVYMSTASEVPIITVDGLAPVTLARNRKPLMVVDISVPRNVEADVGDDADPTTFSYNVDHLKAVVARNTAARRREILEAEGLLRDELADYAGWQESLDAVPTIAKLQEKVEAMRSAEVSKNSNKLKNLSDKEMEAVDRLSRGIVNKLLHGPMSHLRSNEGPDDKRRTLSTLNALFRLEDTGSGRGKPKKR